MVLSGCFASCIGRCMRNVEPLSHVRAEWTSRTGRTETGGGMPCTPPPVNPCVEGLVARPDRPLAGALDGSLAGEGRAQVDGFPLAFLLADLQVDDLDHHAERHREEDVALRDVDVEALRDQREADQD